MGEDDSIYFNRREQVITNTLIDMRLWFPSNKKVIARIREEYGSNAARFFRDKLCYLECLDDLSKIPAEEQIRRKYSKNSLEFYHKFLEKLSENKLSRSKTSEDVLSGA